MQEEVSEEKITQDELRELFGESLPIEVVNLVFSAPGDMTVPELRREIRRLAKKYELDTKLRSKFTDVIVGALFPSFPRENEGLRQLPKVRKTVDRLIAIAEAALGERNQS